MPYLHDPGDEGHSAEPEPSAGDAAFAPPLPSWATPAPDWLRPWWVAHCARSEAPRAWETLSAARLATYGEMIAAARLTPEALTDASAALVAEGRRGRQAPGRGDVIRRASGEAPGPGPADPPAAPPPPASLEEARSRSRGCPECDGEGLAARHVDRLRTYRGNHAESSSAAPQSLTVVLACDCLAGQSIQAAYAAKGQRCPFNRLADNPGLRHAREESAVAGF
jgi:hypothetical protein